MKVDETENKLDVCHLSLNSHTPAFQRGSFCLRNVTHHVQQDPEGAALNGILK